MTTLVRPALREVRSRLFDSARWAGYRPRPDDIIIATFPKCGTTWMQRIVSMLLAGSSAAAPVAGTWFDFRLRGPVEPVLEETPEPALDPLTEPRPEAEAVEYPFAPEDPPREKFMP